MNKQGKSAASFILTAGVVIGLIYLIVFMIWGVGGGFSALYGIGKIMKQIPAWFYIVVALIWLTKSMFGSRR